jgi:HPt (histidine-containing phosphotransfer) domain-containing protein
MKPMRILLVAAAPPLDIHAALRPLGAVLVDVEDLSAALESQKSTPCDVVVLDARASGVRQSLAAMRAALLLPRVEIGEPGLEGSVPVASLAAAVMRAGRGAQALPAIDWKDLRERLDGDDDLAREILAAFSADAPGLVARLGGLIRAEADLTAIARLAHQIKGAAANASARAMRASSSQIELSGKAGVRAVMAEHLEELEAGLAALLEELAKGRQS